MLLLHRDFRDLKGAPIGRFTRKPGAEPASQLRKSAPFYTSFAKQTKQASESSSLVGLYDFFTLKAPLTVYKISKIYYNILI